MTGVSENAAAAGTDAATHRGYADGDTVATFREQLRDWLTARVALERERLCDIVLATDEALANVVDHAYRDDEKAGRMTMDLAFDAAAETVRICVTDQGRWREPPPTTVTSPRGRGLTLMKVLADASAVDGRTDGTSVCLSFRRCPVLEDAAASAG